MDKLRPDKHLPFPKEAHVPQLQIHSGLKAGASLQSCLDNLDYWRNQYFGKCGYIPPYGS